MKRSKWWLQMKLFQLYFLWVTDEMPCQNMIQLSGVSMWLQNFKVFFHLKVLKVDTHWMPTYILNVHILRFVRKNKLFIKLWLQTISTIDKDYINQSPGGHYIHYFVKMSMLFYDPAFLLKTEGCTYLQQESIYPKNVHKFCMERILIKDLKTTQMSIYNKWKNKDGSHRYDMANKLHPTEGLCMTLFP